MVASFGIAVTAFVPNLEWAIITFGFIAGTGLGVFTAAPVISVAYWFEKRLNLANGLAAAGKDK